MPKARPVIVVVDDDDESLGTLVRELEQRYATHYEVVGHASGAGAIEMLRDFDESSTEVAVVLADHRLGSTSGVDVLVAAREFHPTARRGLLVERTDRLVTEEIARASVLGYIDHHLAKPAHDPDEGFHRAVTELLDEWWSLRGGGFEEFTVVGDERSARSHELRDVLVRNSHPAGFLQHDSAEGRAVLADAGLSAERLPVLIMPGGRALVDPTNADVGAALGVPVHRTRDLYDVAIIGAGPAGLAAAVYAASEGLRTVLIEGEAMGGQAGTSSLIRNYLGFPSGISGADLAYRAFKQAALFGAEIIYGNTATSLRAEGDRRIVELSNGTTVSSSVVVIATGASYARLQVPALETFVGSGVFYGAPVVEAPALVGANVYIIGGGNSAGQAATHLARFAERVTLLVRADSLSASMSEYLVTQLHGLENVTVRLQVEVVGGGGHGRLEWLELRDRRSGQVDTSPAAALFVLIGATPFTDWLPDEVGRDTGGYVLTGQDATQAGDTQRGRGPSLFETSMEGVFAVGDARHGSVKRVAGAVGDGSTCVSLIHDYLARLVTPTSSHR